MDAVRLLWIDLSTQPSDQGLFKSLSDEHEATRVDRLESAPGAIHQLHPQLACIEFDYPDEIRLQAVRMLKLTFPTLPLLMFTEYHSEALAVWAFRSGVWDYRVKPVTGRTLARSIKGIMANVESRVHDALCRNRLSEGLIAPAGHLQRPPLTARKTSKAIAYITRHFDHDITRDALADLCHLSRSEFSRAFKNEQDTTFEHFLLEYRIAKARNFLTEPHMTISQAAYFAGFNDTSYFSRIFKRLSGVTPSDYQRRVRLAPI